MFGAFPLMIDAYPPTIDGNLKMVATFPKIILTKAPTIGAFLPMIDAFPSTIGRTLKMVDAFLKIIFTTVVMIVTIPIYFVGTPLSNFSIIKSISTIPP